MHACPSSCSIYMNFTYTLRTIDLAESVHPSAFQINSNIFALFPNLQVGVVIASGLDNRGDKPEIADTLRAEEERVMQQFAGTQSGDHPQIATWRDAYRVFGVNPRKYPSSIENLVGRVLRGYPVRHINKLVDIYNTISLRYILPVGGEDLDKVDGDISLTIASEDEEPAVLLGENEARAPLAGEVIYKDAAGAICRRFNWKEADRTKLTEETTRSILVVEALPPVETAQLQQALSELAAMIERHCGGGTTTAILNAARPQLAL